MSSFYITTAIPYVNSTPHIGFALELVQADTLARHRRSRGDGVRFLTGTDDNSLKNVQAAHTEGIDIGHLVDRNAGHFEALREPFDLSFDDFIRTSSDPRHAPGAARLWEAAVAAGDLYKKPYQGRYCVGCEQFYSEEELVDGRCPEHGTVPQPIAEDNWFFRLSRYARQLRELIASDTLRIRPEVRKNEVLGFIDGGLTDFSVSRSAERSHGWGVPVPGDPSQVMYVWFDALSNYINALDYATTGESFQQWWTDGDQRVHVIGKGIIRFHAVYWPAMLLSAGLRLPSEILVHDYLTAGGRKIGKSLGNAIDPVAIVEQYGGDAVRWWLLREVPQVGDTDFTVDRLVNRANEDLANGLGNLVNRVTSMVHKYREGRVPELTSQVREQLDDIAARVSQAIDSAMADYDLRAAASAVWELVDQANRFVQTSRPWDLAKAERTGDEEAGRQLDLVLARLVADCRLIGLELQPFLPRLAERVTAACAGDPLPTPVPVFPRLELD